MSIVAREGIVYCEDDENDIATLTCKRARIRMDKLIDSKRPYPDVEDICSSTDTRVLLLRGFFLSEEKTGYVSSGFYPADNYLVLAEFGGPRIAPITLTEQHVKPLMEHLPALCEAMYRCENYTCKDGLFLLQSTRTHATARMYRDKNCVSFRLVDLRYMMNMLHFVQFQQTQYILAQNDVMSFAILTLGTIEFVETLHTAAGLLPYDQLFDELKMKLI